MLSGPRACMPSTSPDEGTLRLAVGAVPTHAYSYIPNGACIAELWLRVGVSPRFACVFNLHRGGTMDEALHAVHRSGVRMSYPDLEMWDPCNYKFELKRPR
jgi:hypothetical protein